MDMKPDPDMLRSPFGSHSNFNQNRSLSRVQPPSPESMTNNSMPNYGSPGSTRSTSPPTSGNATNYPPNHPLSGSKHFCSICGDRASGKHYGVFSCEGCKGFFKRTVRKELTYACRESRNCIIDKRQRNRCQYCRYMKCLEMGMRREAVQEERNRGSGGQSSGSGGVAREASVDLDIVPTFSHNDMPMERIVEAEDISDSFANDRLKEQMSLNSRFGGLTTRERMLQQLLQWAKFIPHFNDLKREDQIKLIRFSWNELMIASYAFRSLDMPDGGILLSDGLVVRREEAHVAGVGEIFDRIHVELIGKMKEMRMEKCELGCLRAIVLFNPDARGLDAQVSGQVENFREMVYATLEEHCRANHESEPSRFAKLLLRLPALRSIGLKCAEHTFFFKLIKEERPVFNGADIRDLDGETGIYDERNPVDNFMQTILDD